MTDQPKGNVQKWPFPHFAEYVKAPQDLTMAQPAIGISDGERGGDVHYWYRQCLKAETALETATQDKAMRRENAELRSRLAEAHQLSEVYRIELITKRRRKK